MRRFLHKAVRLVMAKRKGSLPGQATPLHKGNLPGQATPLHKGNLPGQATPLHKGNLPEHYRDIFSQIHTFFGRESRYFRESPHWEDYRRLLSSLRGKKAALYPAEQTATKRKLLKKESRLNRTLVITGNFDLDFELCERIPRIMVLPELISGERRKLLKFKIGSASALSTEAHMGNYQEELGSLINSTYSLIVAHMQSLQPRHHKAK